MRPGPDEHAAYYTPYIQGVHGDNIFEVLGSYNVELLKSVSPDKENHSYAPGKWTIKQVVEHIIDAERVFAYRALRIARGDTQPLPGFDQEEYVKNGTAERRTLADLTVEFELLRKCNLLMFRSFGEKELKRRGTASGYEVTVRALLFIIAGHQIHHINIIKERYLG